MFDLKIRELQSIPKDDPSAVTARYIELLDPLNRPGRPKIGAEIRAFVCCRSWANPLWGAPRIHGELLKLGIKISQATVGRWMPWRPKVPSPTWRTFLRNHLPDLAAIDMFVVATATFPLLYTLIVLS